MKVLIVSSSPRKEGNSDVLCDRFARGASEAGHEVEKIMLRDKKYLSAMPVMLVWKHIPVPLRMTWRIYS